MPEPTIPYSIARVESDEIVERLQEQYEVASLRRTVRRFSSEPVPREAIELAIKIAGTAPSGAHRQPWYFVAIEDPELRRQIREAAELEETAFYERRAPEEWLQALKPFDTNPVKEHITGAPWIIVVFRRDYDLLPDGTRQKCYYMSESVGIAVGFLIQALHRAGLATLTHTPSPMTFLREICNRPLNEKPYLLIPVGYPAPDCRVPDIQRKSLDEIAEFR